MSDFDVYSSKLGLRENTSAASLFCFWELEAQFPRVRVVVEGSLVGRKVDDAIDRLFREAISVIEEVSP